MVIHHYHGIFENTYRKGEIKFAARNKEERITWSSYRLDPTGSVSNQPQFVRIGDVELVSWE